MSIEELAKVACDWLRTSDKETIVTMVAIGGPESAYIVDRPGDHLSNPIFTPADRILYAPCACNGYLSHGYMQIFLGVHHEMIATMSGITDPCGQAHWLYDPDNNMRAASAILTIQGLTAWSAYKVGAHLPFMDRARAAVDAVLAPPVEPPALPMVVSYAELGNLRYLRFGDGSDWVLALTNPRFDVASNGALTFDVEPRT